MLSFVNGIVTIFGPSNSTNQNSNTQTNSYLTAFQTDSQYNPNLGIIRIPFHLHANRIERGCVADIAGALAFTPPGEQSTRFIIDCTRIILCSNGKDKATITVSSLCKVVSILQDTTIFELYVPKLRRRTSTDISHQILRYESALLEHALTHFVLRCFMKNALIYGTQPGLGVTTTAHVQATMRCIPLNDLQPIELNVLAVFFNIHPSFPSRSDSKKPYLFWLYVLSH